MSIQCLSQRVCLSESLHHCVEETSVAQVAQTPHFAQSWHFIVLVVVVVCSSFAFLDLLHKLNGFSDLKRSMTMKTYPF